MYSQGIHDIVNMRPWLPHDKALPFRILPLFLKDRKTHLHDHQLSITAWCMQKTHVSYIWTLHGGPPTLSGRKTDVSSALEASADS